MPGARPVCSPHRRVGARVPTALAFGFCLAGLLPAAAWARSEIAVWVHPMPCQVDSFELRWGASPDALTNVRNVGRPRQAGRQFSYVLDVADDAEIYACVAAIRGSQVSACSNDLLFSPADPQDHLDDPAPPEAQRMYCEDFTGGSFRAPWLDTAPGGSMVPDDSLFDVVDLGGSNYVLQTSSAQRDIHSHFLGTSMQGVPALQWQRYELSGEMMITDATGSVGVTVYSRYNQAPDYYRLGYAPGGAFRLERDYADPSFHCTEASTGISALPNVWYAFRVRARETDQGTAIQAKVWPADQREPSGFRQASCVDVHPSRALSGAIGVWSAGGGAKRWDDLSVSSVPTVPLPTDPIGQAGKPELVR